MATFSNQEYTDIHFIYGYWNGNAKATVWEYRRRFPFRRIPNQLNLISHITHLILSLGRNCIRYFRLKIT